MNENTLEEESRELVQVKRNKIQVKQVHTLTYNILSYLGEDIILLNAIDHRFRESRTTTPKPLLGSLCFFVLSTIAVTINMRG